MTRGPRSVGAAMLSSRKGTGKRKASGSVYAEKKTFFGATEEGGVKALVYELGTGNANGERIEETSPALDVCPNIQRGDGAAAAIHACA